MIKTRRSRGVWNSLWHPLNTHTHKRFSLEKGRVVKGSKGENEVTTGGNKSAEQSFLQNKRESSNTRKEIFQGTTVKLVGFLW